MRFVKETFKYLSKWYLHYGRLYIPGIYHYSMGVVWKWYRENPYRSGMGNVSQWYGSGIGKNPCLQLLEPILLPCTGTKFAGT